MVSTMIFIREQKSMAAVQNGAQHLSPPGTAAQVGADQYGRIEYDSQMIGL